MGRTYGKTLQFLEANGNDELYNIFNNITSDTIEDTYVMDNLLDILSDNTIYSLNDEYRLKLVMALKVHFELVWTIKYVDNLNIDRLLNFMKEDIYFIEAYNGYRMATKNEVEHGVAGLVCEERWLLGDDGPQIYKQFNMLQWAITGRLTYYRRAGLEYTWGDNGLEETFIQLFSKSTEITKQLYELLKDKSRFNAIVSSINKAIRRGRNKYPDFAPDEIEIDMSKKQLVYKAQGIVWKYEGFVESKRILSRIKKDTNYKVTPLDISILRRDYEEITSITFQGKKVAKKGLTEEQQAIKDKCDQVEKYVTDGVLKKDEFSLKIIQTLKKYNYRFCSDKQMKIIMDSIDKANKAIENNTNTKVMTDDDIPDMVDDIFDVMNALGKGELQVEYGDDTDG